MEGGDAGVQHNERRKGKHVYSTVLKRIGQSIITDRRKFITVLYWLGEKGKQGH